MRCLALTISVVILTIPTVTRAADLEPPRSVVSVEERYGGETGYYRTRTDARVYEAPSYQDASECRVRIVRTPYGIERIRDCPDVVVRRY